MNAPVLLASDLLMANNAKILTNAPLKMEGASISATIPSALFHALVTLDINRRTPAIHLDASILMNALNKLTFVPKAVKISRALSNASAIKGSK